MSVRDLGAAAVSFAEWYRRHHPDVGAAGVSLEALPGAGYSNEVLFATVGPQRLVVRLAPSGPGLFPSYDLGMQVAVQEAAASAGVPVPAPIEHEPDPSWLGAPFLVMPRIDGLAPSEMPAFDEAITSLSADEQGRLQRSFLDTLAAINRTPWERTALAAQLRGAGATLGDEVAWWEELARWSFDGALPREVTELFVACRRTLPAREPEPGVLWGDVRLGNVIFSGLVPVAVLDWEMASIGPAEHDLAWYLALDELAAHFVDVRVPGFLERDGVVAAYEAALGRPVLDLAWYEAFALCRATVLHLRTERLAGRVPGSVADNAMFRRTAEVVGVR